MTLLAAVGGKVNSETIHANKMPWEGIRCVDRTAGDSGIQEGYNAANVFREPIQKVLLELFEIQGKFEAKRILDL
jgi:hypothetical protein